MSDNRADDDKNIEPSVSNDSVETANSKISIGVLLLMVIVIIISLSMHNKISNDIDQMKLEIKELYNSSEKILVSLRELEENLKGLESAIDTLSLQNFNRYRIEGSIVDENYNPIPFANVIIEDSIHIVSKIDGKYDYLFSKLPNNQLKLVIRKNGYDTEYGGAKLLANQTVIVRHVLKKKD